MRRILFVLTTIIVAFSGSLAVCEDVGREEKKTFMDIITNPFQSILAPVTGEGLADIITKPLDILTYPIAEFGEIVTTPGRTKEYIYNINKSVSVIDSEDIKEADPKSLQQILSRKAGIVVSGYFANPKDNSVDMRGFGEAGPMNYVVLIDGRRTNQIDMSGPDLSQIDVNSIERIEIIRGANSVLYGDNATGGVINIITKRGAPEDHLEYTQEFGSYRYNKEYFSASGGHDFLDYFFSYSYQDSDGYRLNNAYEANDIFTSFTIKPADYLDIHLSSGIRDWEQGYLRKSRTSLLIG